MKKIWGILFLCVLNFNSAFGANSNGPLSGVWQGEAEFNYAFPFPFREVAYEIWQLGLQGEISVTRVIGQHNETFDGEYSRKGEAIYVTLKGQAVREYNLIPVDSRNFSLCAEECRHFTKIDERPSLPRGSYTTPAVQMDWSWSVNGEGTQNSLAIMILRDSHNDVAISGQAFVYVAPSKVVYDVVMVNYLIGEDPHNLASYGFLLLMAAIDDKTGTSKFIAGTFSKPAFFSWGEEQLVSADYDGDHVEFRLRLSPYAVR